MSAPATCNKKKQRRRMLKTMEKKPIFIFTDRILLLFCSQSSVCKIDITLYIISFLEKYCKLSSPGPLLLSPAPAYSLGCVVEKYLIRIVFLSFSCVRRDRLSHPYRQGQKNRQEIGFLVVVRIYIFNVFTSLHKPGKK
jgi:hypothetical protein